MNSLLIYKKAEELKKKYASDDPIRIAREAGIRVYREDLGSLLGMYTRYLNHRLMFINEKVENDLEKMVAAHELGHAVLHEKLAGKGGFREFSLFRMKNITEYEANAFAAHLLLTNEEVMALAEEGHDVVSLAGLLHSDINLMLIKLQEMNKLGYTFRIPYDPKSDFLGKKDLKEESERK